MSIWTKISAAWTGGEKLGLIVVGIIVGFLAASIIQCNKEKAQAVMLSDTIHRFDTVASAPDTEYVYYKIKVYPTIDGDSVRYYRHEDSVSSLVATVSADGALDLDARLLYIRDTVTITHTIEVPQPPTMLSSAFELHPLFRFGAAVEMAASPMPERAVSIAGEGYLKVGQWSAFVRPQYIYPQGAFLWGGVRYEFK